MAAIGDLVATMRMNTKPFEAGAARAKSTLGRLGQAAGSMVAKIGAGPIAAIAAGVAIAGVAIKKVITFMREAVNVASDLEEVMNKFNVVFGKSAGPMKKWADDFAATMGRSKRQVAEFLSGAQDLFVPLGFGADEATRMSKQVTQLAIDLASFNNMADADVMRDLQAAMTGSGEVMKKYGVIVSEAAVKQELMNQGMSKKQANAASNVAKVQARLNIILRGTLAAQGDTIRSADSYANSLKALTAEVENLKGEIGTALLPVFNLMIKGARMLLSLFKVLQNQVLMNALSFAKLAQIATLFRNTRVNEAVSNLTNFIAELNVKAGEASVNLDATAVATNRVVEASGRAAKEVKKMASAWDTIRDLEFDIKTFDMSDIEKQAQKMRDKGVREDVIGFYVEKAKEQEALQKKDDTKQRAAEIKRSLEGPGEKLQRELWELVNLLKEGAIDQGVHDRAVKAANKQYEDATKKKEKQTKVDPQQAKALLAGSREAMNRILGSGKTSKREKDAKETAINTKRTADAVEEIAQKEVEEVSIP